MNQANNTSALRWLAISLMCVAGVIAETGCQSRPELFNDVRASRRAAYQRWEARRADASRSKTRIAGTMTLDDAVQLALTNNKRLKSIVYEKQKARGQIVEAYSYALPHVTLTGSFMHLNAAPYAEFSLSATPMKFDLGMQNNYSVDLKVYQPIWHGGATFSAMRAARLYSLLSDQEVRAGVQDTVFNVSKSYYDVLLLEKLVAVNADAVRSAESHLKQVQANREEGIATDFDLLRAKVALSNHQAELIQQTNRLHLARANLFNEIGVIADDDVTLAGELAYRPMEPVFEKAVELAYENSPELYQADIGERMQKEALAIAKSQYWPMIDAVVQQSFGRPNPLSTTADEWGTSTTIGAVLTWNLFDGLGREGRVIQRKAELMQSRMRLENAQDMVELGIRKAVLNIRDAEKFVESQSMNLKLAARGLELAELGYKEGVNTEVEVIDAQTALTMSKALYYQALHAHAQARLALYRAMGMLDPDSKLNGIFDLAKNKSGASNDSPSQTPETNAAAGTEAPANAASGDIVDKPDVMTGNNRATVHDAVKKDNTDSSGSGGGDTKKQPSELE